MLTFLLALVATVPHGPVVHHVGLMEVNTYGEQGISVQVIYWDNYLGDYRVVGWRYFHDRAPQQSGWGGVDLLKMDIVQAKRLIHTETLNDPERDDYKKWGSKHRYLHQP